MKKKLLKPLLIGTMSFAMAFSVSATVFADDTAPADTGDSGVITWAQLYSSMGLQAPTGEEGLYDAVSSATGIALNNHYSHIPTVIHQVDTGEKIVNADGTPKTDKNGKEKNALLLDGVVLNNPADVIQLKVDTKRTTWSKFDARTLAASKVYGTDKFTVYPDNTCEGYTWMEYKSKVYAVTISDGTTTVGALPWIDFYVENGHTDQVEIALNSGKVSAGCENGATVHRFDAFYTDGVLNPGTYTVSVYADGYSTLVADIVVPTWTEATVKVDNIDVEETTAAVTLTDLPADYDPAFTVDGTEAAYADGSISCGKLAIGSHTVKVTDKNGKYNGLSAAFMVSTDQPAAAYDGYGTLIPAQGSSQEDFAAFLKNITLVTINDTAYDPVQSKKNKNPVKVIAADGSIDLSATAFAESSEAMTITVTATGYPDLTFTHTPLKDGTYTGIGRGFRGNIKLEVTISGGKITGIKEISQVDDAAYWKKAAAIFDTITAANSTDVDVISGATFTCRGIKNAVDQARMRAQGISSDPDASIFAGGDGTAENPFLIKTANQMVAFAGSLSDLITYEGYYITLSGDIDLSGIDWNPIGGQLYLFGGDFDGNGHAIKGLTMGSAAAPKTDGFTEDENHVGLFGKLGETAVIENLNIDNLYINVDSKKLMDVGAVAGETQSSSTGGIGAVINNVHASGSITVNNDGDSPYDNIWAGGLVGRTRGGSIINSGAAVDVKATEQQGAAWLEAGGLAGMDLYSFIANSYASGDVYANIRTGNTEAGKDDEEPASTIVGGLTGLEFGTVVNCYASGDVTSVYPVNNIGALSGWLSSSMYHSFYHTDAVLTSGESVIAASDVSNNIGKSAVNDGNTGLPKASAKSLPNQLNSSLDVNALDFPVIITDYLPETTTLTAWVYDTASGAVVHEGQQTAQVQPQLQPQKSAQNIKVTAAAKTFKAKALKKKAKSFKLTSAVKVTGAKGKVTYTVKPANAKSKKALKYKNGKITVKKKTKKGTYKVKVTVNAAATDKYLAAKPVTKTLTIKVK
ncbi:MAG: FMN-binding protein [Firmicutes bacterium]|nr:FMN-binding protein [Bacillota bacterium]